MLHSCNNRCFTSTPTTSLYHQFRLPLRLFSRRTRALLWRERHHSSSRFCWCPFTSHLFLRNRPIQRAPFWRKKRTAVQQIPNPNPRKLHHRNSVTPKKGKQAHQSQQAPQAPPSESQDHSPTSHQDRPTSHSKKHHSSPTPPP